MRHTKIWKVEAKGRDKGKSFLITEMSSSKGESFAFRALLALINNNVQLPDNFTATGWAGLAQIGFQGLTGLPYLAAQPLLEEMMECVQILPDYPKYTNPRPLSEEAEDIEEVTTRLNLRVEIFKLHVDFSEAALQSLVERVRGIAAIKKNSNTDTGSQK